MRIVRRATTCTIHELPHEGESACAHCERPFPKDARQVSFETLQAWKRETERTADRRAAEQTHEERRHPT
jgi:hypothetical protein